MSFRFGGVNFPPMIYFKVFLCNTNGEGVKYISGRRMIRACPLVSTFSKLITCCLILEIIILGCNVVLKTHTLTYIVTVIALEWFYRVVLIETFKVCEVLMSKNWRKTNKN